MIDSPICVTHHLACDCRGAVMAESMQTQRRVIDWRDQSDEGLRLRCGELTSQEIRTIRAVLGDILPLTDKAEAPNSSGNHQPCDWKQDDDGNWDTSCNQCVCFEHAPPFEQGYKFCHHCGLTINFIEHEPEPPFEDFGGME